MSTKEQLTSTCNQHCGVNEATVPMDGRKTTLFQIFKTCVFLEVSNKCVAFRLNCSNMHSQKRHQNYVLSGLILGKLRALPGYRNPKSVQGSWLS